MRRTVIKLRAAAALLVLGVILGLMWPQTASAATTQMTATVGLNIGPAPAPTPQFSAASIAVRRSARSAAPKVGPRSPSLARLPMWQADTSPKGKTCRHPAESVLERSRSPPLRSTFVAAQASPIG